MHIMEGYLEPFWCIVWFAVMIPFVIIGIKKLRSILREHPEQKMTVALSGAFIFLLSSLKLPSATGSSSHPTGTSLATVLYGVCVCSVLSLIVLIFQALLLAHGGLTTLGANCVSMGIIGPLFGLVIWKLLVNSGVKVQISMFVSAFVAGLMTYVSTSVQMTLNVVTANSADFMKAFSDFISIYAVTQIPLAIIEGMIFAIFAQYLVTSKPEVFGLSGVRLRGLSPDEEQEHARKNRRIYIGAVVVIIIMVIATLAYGTSQGFGFGGSDDLGGIGAESFGYEAWTKGIWGDYVLPTETESLLFACLAGFGALVIGIFIGTNYVRKRFGISDEVYYSDDRTIPVSEAAQSGSGSAPRKSHRAPVIDDENDPIDEVR